MQQSNDVNNKIKSKAENNNNDGGVVGGGREVELQMLVDQILSMHSSNIAADTSTNPSSERNPKKDPNTSKHESSAKTSKRCFHKRNEFARKRKESDEKISIDEISNIDPIDSDINDDDDSVFKGDSNELDKTTATSNDDDREQLLNRLGSAFDEESYISNILNNEIHKYEDSNNNENSSELTDFEKQILAKYMNQLDTNEESPEGNPDSDPNRDSREQSATYSDHTAISNYSQNSSQSADSCFFSEEQRLTRDNTIDDDHTDIGSRHISSASNRNRTRNRRKSDGQLANSDGASSRGNPDENGRLQGRNQRRFKRNLSVWVGVTSCVWGLLLYFVRSYLYKIEL